MKERERRAVRDFPGGLARASKGWLSINLTEQSRFGTHMEKLPLAQLAEMALKVAVEKVVEEHVRDGRPLHIWRDGKVIEVSAQELREQSTRT